MPSNPLVNANQAARCQHIKVNGTRCGSPARHGRDHCCFHDSATRRNQDFVLPIIEDAASLQLALNKILQALVDKLIEQKTASTLLYGLQIASANLKLLQREQSSDRIDRMLRATQEQAQSPTANHPAKPATQPAKLPPVAVREPGRVPSVTDGESLSPVDEFLRKFANRNSPTANDLDHPITRPPDHPIASDKSQSASEDEPTFDINACADPICYPQNECHPDRSGGSRIFPIDHRQSAMVLSSARIARSPDHQVAR